jgi:hypothetical protein
MLNVGVIGDAEGAAGMARRFWPGWKWFKQV